MIPMFLKLLYTVRNANIVSMYNKVKSVPLQARGAQRVLEI